MAVNLQKGQRVSLDNSMKMALVGLGWDPNRYDGGYDFDLDASAFLLGKNGKVLRDEDFVFYGNLETRNGAVKSMGDDTTGGNSDEGDDEQIFIDFSKIPAEIDKIAITVTIYDAVNRRQNFGQVSNAYVRVAKIQNEFDTVGEEVIHFDLEEEFSIETALVVCEIYRKNGEWKFNAVASGYQGGLEALCRQYGVNV
ncbi:TerD family protein [Blautia obeum]|uniref:TerD family protein n=1 Tax=Blautia obeum TaxID=40520 RepID=UPI003F894866